MVLDILFYIFLPVVLLQLFYYVIFNNLHSTKRDTRAAGVTPVSVIICARNEEGNLTENLPVLLGQDYEVFEVVVINDGSTDGTAAVLEAFSKTAAKLRILTVPPSGNATGNKKEALTLGIQAAKYDHLLLTDADCKPASTHWIAGMTAHFSDKKKIVLGYGAYEKIAGSLLNKLIRYETLLTAVQYMAWANAGMPYMGVGRNLAYSRPLLEEQNGFVKHRDIRSGDDDLFINGAGHAENVAVCITKGAFTISKAKTNFGDWFKQKRRHITTAVHYKLIHKILLALFYISQFLFWTLAIILLAFSFHWWYVTALIAIRWTVQYWTLGIAAKKLDEHDLTPYAPLLDFLLVFTQLRLFFTNLMAKPDRW